MATAKSSRVKVARPQPPWAQQWPRSGDVAAWMRVLLAVSDHIDDVDLRFRHACSAIRELARLGHVDEAIAHISMNLAGLPPARTVTCIGWHLLAAELWFEQGQLEHMQASLDHAALQLADLHEPAAKVQAQRVRMFQWNRGLLEPADVAEESMRPMAALHRQGRLARLAAQADPSAARQHVASALAVTADMPGVLAHIVRMHQLRLCVDLHLKDLAEQVLTADDAAGTFERLPSFLLAEFDQRERALKRIETEVHEARDALRGGSVNAHMQASQFERAIATLIGLGQMDRARQYLRIVQAEAGSGSLTATGAFSAAVYRSLGKATLMVEGREAARDWLQRALGTAGQERSAFWRKGADRANVEFVAELEGPVAALDAAAHIRSPVERRRAVARLWAQLQGWDELHAVINAAQSASEAAEIVWWTKFLWRPAV